MVPTPGQAARDKGLRVMSQKNCAACHVIEPGTVEWTDDDGHPHSVRGQFFVLEDEVLPPPLEGGLGPAAVGGAGDGGHGGRPGSASPGSRLRPHG